MTPHNKVIARGFMETIFSGHDVDAVDRFVAPDFVDHNPWEARPPTREGWKAGAAEFVAAFPDLRCEIDDLIAEGDRVAVRNRLMGTHRGEFVAPPTGRWVEFRSVDIVRLVDGRIVEHWGLTDALTFLRQIGQLPGS
jgi:predicted ester cyclase